MPRFTKADMQCLHNLSEEGTPARIYTEETKFSPGKFRETLERFGLKKDIHYLFECSIDDVIMMINKGEISGYLKFRLQVGK